MSNRDQSTETTTNENERTDESASEVRPMLNAEQVLAIIPISRTTLFRLERDKVFPQGEPITPHRKLWFKDEVVAWQRDLRDPKSALSQAMKARAGGRKPGRPPRSLKAV
ncbi:AlpA family phage regulatory protein [Bradyrhizobium barranii]|uniref:AlpA family phage regulatory protein n=1 Tax=Bradyrhizobium barranii subsp. barranii TaxID=2823807 RepID=A0A7Z0QKJ7_9BRAD|nr:AlpA family phage regulatory protein [Bradyrhizobium barranii]UEM17002.1 AlpA family phage regulatory protein [Bradyrhizobium barranii subsp. barranii]UGX98765.1 AlpA family phage regulatory protein [Bradyrhizobium barranii subsp. barranii]